MPGMDYSLGRSSDRHASRSLVDILTLAINHTYEICANMYFKNLINADNDRAV